MNKSAILGFFAGIDFDLFLSLFMIHIKRFSFINAFLVTVITYFIIIGLEQLLEGERKTSE